MRAPTVQTNQTGLDRLLSEANKEGEKKKLWRSKDFLALPSAKKILKLSPEEKLQVVLITIRALLGVQDEFERKATELASAGLDIKPSRPCNLRGEAGYPGAGLEICKKLLREDLPFADEQLASVLETVGTIGKARRQEWNLPIVEPLIFFLERRGTPQNGLPIEVIRAFRAALEFTANAKERRLRDRFNQIFPSVSAKVAGSFKLESERKTEHGDRVRALLKKVQDEAGSLCWNREEVFELKSAKLLLEGQSAEQKVVVIETIAKLQSIAAKIGPYSNKTASKIWNLHHEKGYPIAWIYLTNQLLRRKLPFSENDWKFMLEALGSVGYLWTLAFPFLELFVSAVEKWVKAHGTKEVLNVGLDSTAAALRNGNRA